MTVGAERSSPSRRSIVRARLHGELVDLTDQSWRMARQARYKARNWAPGAKVVAFILLALLAATLGDHILTYIVPLPWWPGTEKFCANQHGLGCDFATHLLADAIVALLVYAVFLSRQSRNSTTWRRRAKTRPHELFTWISPAEGGLTDLAAESAAEGRGLRLTVRLPVWATSRRRDRRAAVSKTLHLRWPRRSSPLIRSILGRDELVRGIADDLEAGCDPQVIVGESATGKTMVLVKLADCLARRRKVPVAVSVQDEGSLDFEGLAYAAFLEVSAGVKKEDLQKQWDELRRRSQVVVLVDDLEKVKRKLTPDQVEAAIRRAARQGLRLVVASRPYGLPPDYSRGRIDLEALRPDDVRKDLARQIRRGMGVPRAQAKSIAGALIDATDMTLTLYYLSLARVLASHGKLSGPPHGAEPRLWLLDQYRSALADGVIRQDAGLRPAQRRSVLDELEPLALARVLGARTKSQLTTTLASWGLHDLNVGKTLGAACRLGVVQTAPTGVVRFSHPTTMAFFASRFLCSRDTEDAAWLALIEKEWGPYRALTLVFATLPTDDPKRVAMVVNRLLKRAAKDGRASGGTARTGSTWLTAAAEIGRHGHAVDDEVAGKIVQRIEAELDATEQLGREHLRLLSALGALCRSPSCPDPYRALWKYAMTETDYSFSRRATRELLDAPGAVDALFGDIELTITRTRSYAATLTTPALDDRNSEVFDGLRALAWILPSVRSVIAANTARLRQSGGGEQRVAELERQGETLDRYQDELVGYAQTLTVQLGLEAAVAQGIKFAAFRDHKLPPDPVGMRMLTQGDGRARFWFSRLLLVQAVARRSNHDDTGAAYELIVAATRDPHIFVRHAAELCLRGIAANKPRKFMFEDLTEVVSGAPYGLTRQTSQLIGDIALALNLNEYGDATSRWAFGYHDEAPACLTGSRRRHEVLFTNRQTLRCPFAHYQTSGCLCPYTVDPPNGARRRELTRAFCRYQRLNARRVPWSPSMRTKHLRDFWARMEDLARF